MKYYHLLLLIALLGALTTTNAIAEEHDDHDVVIGLADMSGEQQQLTLVEDHALEHIELEFSDFMGRYYGAQACWIPGNEALHLMDTTLPDGHYQLELEAVSVPDSVIVFEDTTQILIGSNYAFELRWDDDNPDEGWHFHEHISWGLAPAQVSIGETVTAAFKLVDTSGQYLDSEVFEVELTAIPEPATVGLLALGAILAKRQKPGKG